MLIELEKAKNKLDKLKENMKESGVHFDVDFLSKNVEELENMMQEKGFWDDISKATKISQQTKLIRDKLDKYNSLYQRLQDADVLLELSSEDDSSEQKEIVKEVNSLSCDIEKFRIQIQLSGEYDGNNAIMTLHSGVGGTDAEDWTEMLLRMYTRWAEKKDSR